MATGSGSAAFPAIRRLGPGDLQRCAALSADRGWSPERAKWALLLAAAEAFGVDAPDGNGLAGAVVLTRWGPGLASVGMMLVAARYGRRGLGRALMEHLIDAAGGATLILYATDMGRPLYEKLGFRPVRRSVSFAGTFRPGSGPPASARTAARPAARPAARLTVRPATEADMAAVLAVDRAAFGADRGRILARLPGFAERMVVIGGGQRITGYAAAWRSGGQTVAGPVIAPDGEAAKRLIADLAGAARTPVRLDLDPDRPELPGWARARGLEPVSRTAVMARGDLPPRGVPERVFAPISVALA